MAENAVIMHSPGKCIFLKYSQSSTCLFFLVLINRNIFGGPAVHVTLRQLYQLSHRKYQHMMVYGEVRYMIYDQSERYMEKSLPFADEELELTRKIEVCFAQLCSVNIFEGFTIDRNR